MREERILTVDDLTVSFETFDSKVTALSRVDLKLDEGEFLGVVGGTGSGKSVLLRSIINLVPLPGKIETGRVTYKEKNLLEQDEESMDQIRGSEITLILPNPRSQLDPLMKTGDQIASVMRAHQKVGKEEASERALEMLTKVGISDPIRRMDAYPHELSGGMCQRIVIAMALINSPKIVLADEPTSGLDVTVQRQILDLLAELIDDFGSSSIMVTRDLGVVANYCQRIAVMFEGRLVEIDRVEHFFERARHPVSLHLLGSTLAAKGKRSISPEKIKLTAEHAQGVLEEVEAGHFVRLKSNQE